MSRQLDCHGYAMNTLIRRKKTSNRKTQPSVVFILSGDRLNPLKRPFCKFAYFAYNPRNNYGDVIHVLVH